MQFNHTEVREHYDYTGKVTLVHIPTGVHVSVSSSPNPRVNVVAAYRLLQGRLAYWEHFNAGAKNVR